MDITQALLLSVVEGISEFLPISSTGHLVLFSHLLSVPNTEFTKSFEIIIQLGAILAISVLYWQKFFNLKRGIAVQKRVWTNVLAAFFPTAVIGFILYKLIKSFLLGNESVTIAALLIGAILLIVLEKMHKEKNAAVASIENLSLKQSVLIGLAQSVSIIPGVSRSAASILGAMYLEVKRETAVEFSFLLAIPTMIAATTLDLVKSDFNFTSEQQMILGTGLIGSFIVALIVVRWFVRFIKTNTFIPFGIYRIILAIAYFFIVMR